MKTRVTVASVRRSPVFKQLVDYRAQRNPDYSKHDVYMDALVICDRVNETNDTPGRRLSAAIVADLFAGLTPKQRVAIMNRFEKDGTVK